MKMDFTKTDRITINGEEYPLYGFKKHPPKATSSIPPAGIAPGAEAAMRAEGPKGQIDWSGTVEFTCDITLTEGKVYDYTYPGGSTEKMKILTRNGREYRGTIL